MEVEWLGIGRIFLVGVDLLLFCSLCGVCVDVLALSHGGGGLRMGIRQNLRCGGLWLEGQTR